MGGPVVNSLMRPRAVSMITRIGFQNYRSHDNTEIPLSPVNLLIGSVAAGKSNIFKGLLLLQNSIHRSLEELFPPGLSEFPLVRSRWADDTAPIRFAVELSDLDQFPGETALYKLSLANSPNGLYVHEESLERSKPEQLNLWVFQRGMYRREIPNFGAVDPYEPTLLNRVFHNDLQISKTHESVRFTAEVARSLSRFGYYHLSVAELKALGTGQPSDRIRYYGFGLPDFLAWTKFDEQNAQVYKKIYEAMQGLLPNLDSIIVTQARSDQQGLAMSFKGQRGYIAAPDLSDGTLLTLGLLSLIHGPNRPNLLCIEEPETGLNPRRLRWLFDQFIEMAYPSDDLKATQIIFSTHSPWLIDLFGRNMQESVLLVEQNDGRSRVKPLVDIQRDQLHQQPSSDDAIGFLWASGVYEGL